VESKTFKIRDFVEKMRFSQDFIIVPKVGVKIGKIAFRYSGSQKMMPCHVVEKNTLFCGGGFYFFYFSGIIDFR